MSNLDLCHAERSEASQITKQPLENKYSAPYGRETLTALHRTQCGASVAIAQGDMISHVMLSVAKHLRLQSNSRFYDSTTPSQLRQYCSPL